MSSNTFYTSIEQRGDNILVRGYKDGQKYSEKIHFEPSLYYPTNEESEYHSPDGEPLRKKTYSSIKEMKDSLKTFQGVGNHKYYGTTNIIRQFIADMYPGEISWKPEVAQVWFFDIETTVAEAIVFPEEPIKLKTLESGEDVLSTEVGRCTIHSPYVVWEDGEYKSLKDCKYRVKGFPSPDKALEEIQLISMYNYTQDKGYIFSLKPVKEDNPIFEENADFRSFDSESKLLAAFIMFMRENWIDVMCGWNSEMFDVPYITNRVKIVLGENAATLLSPWKIIQKRTVTVNEKPQETYEWLGICLVDYLEFYKKFNPGSQESFKLDHIAEIEIGKKKVENPYESFVDHYTLGWESFVHYNWVDSTLLRDMEKKMQLIPLAMMVAFDAKININDVVSAMRIWESAIYNHFLEKNEFQIANATKKLKRSIPGAYVHPPIPGKYKWAVSIDATSMYPSAIMQNNISPETKFKKIETSVEELLAGNYPDIPDGYTLSPNGVLCSKEKEGFIPFLIRQKFDQRKAFKKQMLVYETEAQELRDELVARGQ